MKLVPYIVTITLLLNGITACNKPSVPYTPPPPQDTLLGWQRISSGTTGFSDICFLNPARGIAVGDGSYSSSDSGKTWTKITSVADFGVNLFLLNAQRGASIDRNAVYITDDYTNWRAKPSPVTLYSIAPDLQFTSTAICYISSPASGLYKTTDTANTWNKVYTNPVNGMYFFDDNTGVIYDYAANPPADVYKTTDGGAHWQPLSYIPGHAVSYNTMQFVNTQAGWLARGDSLFNTADGGATWYGHKSPVGNITDIQFINNNVGYIAGYTDIYKTTNGGQTWVLNCSIADDPIIEIFFLDEKTGWACCGKGTVLRLKQ